VGRTHAGAVREELQPTGRAHIAEVCGELSPVRGTSCWSKGRVPAPLTGRRERNGSEAEPGKKGGVGGRYCKI